MPMQEAKFERKGHIITDLSTGESTPFFTKIKGKTVHSISRAKQESKRIQVANGGLVRGSVRVVPRKNDRI